ncbi:hypothetical protein [Novosphingobium decolorationis]|uniref:Uncharacterized protein n=1 Tax=Novosphingobium decolorationis TaxID=2698673 RepID=A0ABX8E246_9SPHN|nr:hypothetical protein [Novosphingobium decolorationis]QVM82960.1 hypothetical protein HT578_03865 [Novosphingobium decolorationis]
MAARADQVLRFGHTAEADRATPLWCERPFTPDGERSFLWLIAHHLRGATDHAAFGRGQLEVVRRKLVKTAALILAAIDRIDAELAEDERDQS